MSKGKSGGNIRWKVRTGTKAVVWTEACSPTFDCFNMNQSMSKCHCSYQSASLTCAARRSITAARRLPLVQQAWMPVSMMVLKWKGIRREESKGERRGRE